MEFNFWKMGQSQRVGRRESLDRFPAPMMLCSSSWSQDRRDMTRRRDADTKRYGAERPPASGDLLSLHWTHTPTHTLIHTPEMRRPTLPIFLPGLF